MVLLSSPDSPPASTPRPMRLQFKKGDRTIAVIGTPLSHSYPKENSALQRYIAEHFLIISQVPLKRYEEQDYRRNRAFFPERNVTMSALTEATIIVEAGETSGTLIQAKAAIRQKRHLFILDSCFRDPKLTWPARFGAKGALRVKDYDDIRKQPFPNASLRSTNSRSATILICPQTMSVISLVSTLPARGIPTAPPMT